VSRSCWSLEDIRLIGLTKRPEYSTMSELRLKAIIDAVDHINTQGVHGAVAEMGVYKGGNVALMSWLTQGSRLVWAYDTYEGVPSDEVVDSDVQLGKHGVVEYDSVEHRYQDDRWCYCSLEDVQQNVQQLLFDYSVGDQTQTWTQHLEKIVYIKGSVLETIPNNMPYCYSFIRLDMDIAQPTQHVLPHVWNKLNQYGVLHIDDYGMFGGVRQVVDEFFADRQIYKHEIDDTAISITKLGELNGIEE